jgi:hypothetical protein
VNIPHTADSEEGIGSREMSRFYSRRLLCKVHVARRESKGWEDCRRLGFWVVRFENNHGREPFWGFVLEVQGQFHVD